MLTNFLTGQADSSIADSVFDTVKAIRERCEENDAPLSVSQINAIQSVVLDTQIEPFTRGTDIQVDGKQRAHICRLIEGHDPELREKRIRVLCRDLLDSAERDNVLARLSTIELADRIRDEVWAEMQAFMPASDLVQAGIDRLRLLDQLKGCGYDG